MRARTNAVGAKLGIAAVWAITTAGIINGCPAVTELVTAVIAEFSVAAVALVYPVFRVLAEKTLAGGICAPLQQVPILTLLTETTGIESDLHVFIT